MQSYYPSPRGIANHQLLTNLDSQNWGHVINSNIDFNGKQALNLSWHNGDQFPSSPTYGQVFIHKKNNREIAYQYTGTDWVPIIGYGNMTLYVDGANGADLITKGDGAGSDAFETLGYAISIIPGELRGNVKIVIASGTYTENIIILGKRFAGDYTFTLEGSMSEVLSEQTATGGTQNTITKSSAGWTTNAYVNKLIRLTGGTGSGQIGLIESNTSDTITIYGVWDYTTIGMDGSIGDDPASGTTFVIEDWTSHSKITGNFKTVNIQNLILNKLEMNASSGAAIEFNANTMASIFGCKLSGGNILNFGGSSIFIRDIYALNSGSINAQQSLLTIYNGLIKNSTSYAVGMGTHSHGSVRGCTIDGAQGGYGHGIYANRNGSLEFHYLSEFICNIINNAQWGARAEYQSSMTLASYQYYNNNALGSYSGDAASYAKVT